MSKILVAGLARSGTSTLFANLQHIFAAAYQDHRFVYEPYLWDPDTFDDFYEHYGNRFNTTASLHLEGMYVHGKTPLFLSDTHQLHDHFIHTVIFPNHRHNVLAKAIRANGRLECFLNAVSDLKIILIIRNPLDSINSLVARFSYFGDEFHPSDKDRFLNEITAHHTLDPNLSPESDEIALSRLWWRHMTDAALDVARRYKDRVYVVPYEVYHDDKHRALQRLCAFCDLPISDLPTKHLDQASGPVTTQVHLAQADVSSLAELNRYYWNTLCPEYLQVHLAQADVSSLAELNRYYWNTLCPEYLPADEFDQDQWVNYLNEKYQNASGQPYLREIDTQQTSLAIRRSTRRREQQHLKESKHQTPKQPLRANHALLDETTQLVQSLQDLKYRHWQVQNQIKSTQKSRLLNALGPVAGKVKKALEDIKTTMRIGRQPLDITCVITNYNNGASLRRAVMSVLYQEQPVTQILLADDGSTDGSKDLIQSLANEFPSINSIFRDRNLGPGLNRHLALSEATTTFVTHLDGDDYFALNKIKREAGVLRDDLDAVAFSDILLEFPDRMPRLKVTEPCAQFSSRAQRVLAIATRQTPPPRDMLLSKELYMKAGGYNSVARIYEDWDFKMRLAHICKDWRYSGGLGTHYTRHSSGLSAQDEQTHLYWQLYAIAANFEWLCDYLDHENLTKLLEAVYPSSTNPALVGEYSKFIDAVRTQNINLVTCKTLFKTFFDQAPVRPKSNDISRHFELMRNWLKQEVS